MITLSKLVYKVRMVNINQDLLYVYQSIGMKTTLYLNIDIVLPKTSEVFTAAEVQCFQLRYALDKITRKSNQALVRTQFQLFEPRKLQEHIS